MSKKPRGGGFILIVFSVTIAFVFAGEDGDVQKFLDRIRQIIKKTKQERGRKVSGKRKKTSRKRLLQRFSNPLIKKSHNIININEKQNKDATTFSSTSSKKEDKSPSFLSSNVARNIQRIIKSNPYLMPFKYLPLKEYFSKIKNVRNDGDLQNNIPNTMEEYSQALPYMEALREWFKDISYEVIKFWFIVKKYFEDNPDGIRYLQLFRCSDQFIDIRNGIFGTGSDNKLQNFSAGRGNLFEEILPFLSPLFVKDKIYNINKNIVQDCNNNVVYSKMRKKIYKNSFCTNLVLADLMAKCSKANLKRYLCTPVMATPSSNAPSSIISLQPITTGGMVCQPIEPPLAKVLQCLKSFFDKMEFKAECKNLKADLMTIENFVKEYFTYLQKLYTHVVSPAVIDMCYVKCMCEKIGVNCLYRGGSEITITGISPNSSEGILPSLLYGIVKDQYLQTATQLSDFEEDMKKLLDALSVIDSKCEATRSVAREMREFLNSSEIGEIVTLVRGINTKIKGCAGVEGVNTFCRPDMDNPFLCVPNSFRGKCDSVNAHAAGSGAVLPSGRIRRESVEFWRKECRKEPGCNFIENPTKRKVIEGKEVWVICDYYECSYLPKRECIPQNFCVYNDKREMCETIENFCINLTMEGSAPTLDILKMIGEKIGMINDMINKFKEKLKNSVSQSRDTLMCNFSVFNQMARMMGKEGLGNYRFSKEEMLKYLDVLGIDKTKRNEYILLFDLFNLPLYTASENLINFDYTLRFPPLLKEFNLYHLVEALKYWLATEVNHSVYALKDSFGHLYYLDLYLFIFYIKYKLERCSTKKETSQFDFLYYLWEWLGDRKDFQNLPSDIKFLTMGAVMRFFETLFTTKRFKDAFIQGMKFYVSPEKEVGNLIKQFKVEVEKASPTLTVELKSVNPKINPESVEKFFDRVFPSSDVFPDLNKFFEELEKIKDSLYLEVFGGLKEKCFKPRHPLMDKCELIEAIDWNKLQPYIFSEDALQKCDPFNPSFIPCKLCYTIGSPQWNHQQQAFIYSVDFSPTCSYCGSGLPIVQQMDEQSKCLNSGIANLNSVLQTNLRSVTDISPLIENYKSFIELVKNNRCKENDELYKNIPLSYCKDARFFFSPTVRKKFNTKIKGFLGQEIYELLHKTLEKFAQRIDENAKEKEPFKNINCNEILD